MHKYIVSQQRSWNFHGLWCDYKHRDWSVRGDNRLVWYGTFFKWENVKWRKMAKISDVFPRRDAQNVFLLFLKFESVNIDKIHSYMIPRPCFPPWSVSDLPFEHRWPSSSKTKRFWSIIKYRILLTWNAV